MPLKQPNNLFEHLVKVHHTSPLGYCGNSSLALPVANMGIAPQCMTNPPQTVKHWPVMPDDSSEAKKTATLAISSGWIILPSGTCVVYQRSASG